MTVVFASLSNLLLCYHPLRVFGLVLSEHPVDRTILLEQAGAAGPLEHSNHKNSDPVEIQMPEKLSNIHF